MIIQILFKFYILPFLHFYVYLPFQSMIAVYVEPVSRVRSCAVYMDVQNIKTPMNGFMTMPILVKQFV